MKWKRFSEQQIMKVLEEALSGAPVTEVCPKHNISIPTFYEWKKKYGGMTASDVKELRSVKEENQKLKKLLENALLENDVLKDVFKKSCNAWCSKEIGGVRQERVWVIRAVGVSTDEASRGMTRYKRRSDRNEVLGALYFSCLCWRTCFSG